MAERKQDEQKKPFHEVVAAKLITLLNQGTAPWQKPWEPGQPAAVFPLNPTTGQRYKGINAIFLMAQGHDDQRWMTYKQAEAAGAQVRKGEKGTPIQYWKFDDETPKVDSQGQPVRNAQGEQEVLRVKLERPRVFHATVFNATQIDGLPPILRAEPSEQRWSAVERAEAILEASGATIKHETGNRAFYRTATDSIHLPLQSQFPNADSYYATALHELGHWTGHASRLGRDLSHPFGSEAYAKEELRAEIASMILGDELGIGHDPGQHASYVKSWVKVLENDPMEIVRAAADAEKIQRFIMSFEQIQQQENVQQPDVKVSPVQDSNSIQSVVRPDLFVSTDVQVGRLQDRLVNAGMAMGDARAAAAWRDLHAGSEVSHTVDAQAFQDAAQAAFGFVLPADWTGRVHVQAQVMAGNQAVHADLGAGQVSGFYSVHAQRAGGSFEHLQTVPTRDAAEDLSHRLGLVDAHAEMNRLDQAAKLARLKDDAMRRDPNSTDEQRDAAKEDRERTSAAVVAADPVLSARLEQLGREHEGRALIASQAETVAQPISTRQPVKGAAVGKATFLKVPYREKNEVKALGAKWDRQVQAWYVPAGVDPAAFARWSQATFEQKTVKDQGAEAMAVVPHVPHVLRGREGRQYLAVPYEDRLEAKAAGAEWDKVLKSWYVGPQADPAPLQRWVPTPLVAEQEPAMHPRDEFAEAMRGHGLVVEGDHPIMDGTKHRVPVEGGKPGAVDGFYVLYGDGHPAGRIINHKTGVDEKWKSKGYTLSTEQKAGLQAEAAANLARRAAALAVQHEQAAARVTAQLGTLQPVTEPTPYLAAKGVQVHPGAFTDRDQKTTFIPAIDANNKLWSMQYIQEDGTKRFAKDTRKEGCFHAVGGLDALTKAPAIVIGEGYATAATLSEALGFATVAAFDSGNLKAVAHAMQAKFPNKPIVIAGDDDQHLIDTLGKNPGREKMEEAAQAVGASKLLPVFAPGERDRQTAALTDFNDLATKSVLGREGVERQVRFAVQAAIDTHAVSARALEEQKLVQMQAHRKGLQPGSDEPVQQQRRAARI